MLPEDEGLPAGTEDNFIPEETAEPEVVPAEEPKHEAHVPYERFKEIVDKNKELSDKLSKMDENLLTTNTKMTELMGKIAEGQAAGKTEGEIADTFSEEEKFYMENKGVRAAVNSGVKLLRAEIDEIRRNQQILMNSATEAHLDKFAADHPGFEKDKPKPEFIDFLKRNPNATMHEAYKATYDEADISTAVLAKDKEKQTLDIKKKREANLDTPGVKAKDTGAKKYKTIMEAGEAAMADLKRG